MTNIAAPKIDSHHHFWKYNPEEYSWIGDAMTAIRRDFLPEHLKQEIDKAGIDGVVSVHARQSLAETEWLLDLASRYEFIRAIVGWVPLIEAGLPAVLERLASHAKLKAVRHVLHDEPDDRYMLRDDFNRGIRALGRFGLAYDVLIFERHLPQTIEFVDLHPNQVFIVDHIAKPRIRDGVLSPWRENVQELAKRENVYCKISGVVTEVDYRRWTEAELQPYLETVLEAFGPNRLMFGSDWPVCLVACDYTRWFGIVSRSIGKLSPDEQEMVLGRTATWAYRLTAQRP
jgi:L-fuconolactonase